MKNIDLKNFGSNIKYFRTRDGKTQKQYSEMLNITEAHYQKLETGNASPSLDVILEAGIKIDVPIDCLLRNEGFNCFDAYATSYFYQEIMKYTDEQFKFYNQVLLDIYTQTMDRKAYLKSMGQAVPKENKDD